MPTPWADAPARTNGACTTEAFQSSSSQLNEVPLSALTRTPARSPPLGPNGSRYTSDAPSASASGQPADRQSRADASAVPQASAGQDSAWHCIAANGRSGRWSEISASVNGSERTNVARSTTVEAVTT